MVKGQDVTDLGLGCDRDEGKTLTVDSSPDNETDNTFEGFQECDINKNVQQEHK